MNARFRKGRKYRFTRHANVWIDSRELTYVGFNKKEKDYVFLIPSLLRNQWCPRGWIEEGYVTYEEVKNG